MNEQPENPYTPPQASLGDVLPEAAPHLEPLPFEDPERYPGFAERCFATFKLGYTDFFGLADRVPSRQDLLPPWLFQLIVSLPFGLLGQVLAFALQAALSRLTGSQPQPMLSLVGFVIGVLAGPYVGGAIAHAGLWIWGGTRRRIGLPQSIRLYAYAAALLAPVAWVPILGGLLAMIWLILLGMALARTHRTDTWRGVLAVLTPVLLLCCLGILAAIAIPSLLLLRR